MAMPERCDACRIVIFAKAPLPGLAKTRLIPALGAKGAAHLAKRMLFHAVEQAQAAEATKVELCVTPSLSHPVWQTLALPAELNWSEQGEGDLGMRMARASERITGAGEAVLFMGTDCPGLSASHIRLAIASLTKHDACLIPVSDGGYALLGLRRHLPALFEAIPWSTAEVAALTRQRILEKGWSLQEFDILHDIDEPEDLCWLPASWDKQAIFWATSLGSNKPSA